MMNLAKRYYPDYPGPPRPPGPSFSPYQSQYPSVPTDSGYPTAGPVYVKEYPPVDTTSSPASNFRQNITRQPVTSYDNTDQSDQVINTRYRYFGYALLFLAFAMIGVEIGNVIFTYSIFQINTTTYVKKSFASPYILTWIAPGIWGSIPVFITGYLAIRVAGKNNKLVRIFALFCSLSAVVFTPGIIAINAAEIIMYPTQPTGDTHPTFNGNVCYNLNIASSLSCPKFFLPLIVSALGGFAFLLTFLVTVIFCFCWNPEIGSTETVETETTEVIDEYYPYARYPPYSPAPQVRLPAALPYYEQGPVFRGSPRMIEPDMDFLRSYPVSRPAVSRGFGFAPAYNRQSFGYFPGTLPSLAGFGVPDQNPAYMVV